MIRMLIVITSSHDGRANRSQVMACTSVRATTMDPAFPKNDRAHHPVRKGKPK